MQSLIKNRIEKTFAKWLLALICVGMVGVAEATTYTWTGADTSSANKNWGAFANWTVPTSAEDPTPVTPSVKPGAQDTVIFNQDARVRFTDTEYASNIVVATGCKLTLWSKGNTLAGVYEVGTAENKGGTIALENSHIETYNTYGNTMSWYSDFEINGGTAVTNKIAVRVSGNGSDNTTLKLYGNLSGSGNVRLGREGNGSGRGAISLYGSNTSFAGKAIIDSGASTRGSATFCSATSMSGKAQWIYTGDVDGQNGHVGQLGETVANSTLEFGSYEGKSYIVNMSYDHSGNTYVLGGANVDFETTWSATASASADRSSGSKMKKVGTGTMTLSALGDGTGKNKPCFISYEFNDGTLKFNTTNILSTATGKGDIATDFTFTGGAVTFTEGNVVDISGQIKNSTSPITVVCDNPTEGQDVVTWDGQIPASNTAGLTKKGAKTLVLTKVPKYTGTTKVEEGALVIPNGTTLEDVVISEGASITCTNGVNYTVVFTTDATTGKTKAVAQRVATTYTYVGPTTCNASDLTTVANFKNGDAAAELAPGSLDTVIFNEATEITEDVMIGFNAIVLNADVTLKESTDVPTGFPDVEGVKSEAWVGFRANGVSGEGKLILGNNAVFANNGSAASIISEVKVTAVEDTPATLIAATSSANISLDGSITGEKDAYVKCVNGYNVNSAGIKFNGNGTGYAGTIEVCQNNISRNFTAFDANCDLSGAKVISSFAGANGSGKIFTGWGKTAVYKFGSLTGSVFQDASNLGDNVHPTFEIGARGDDGEITGTLTGRDDRAPYIRKIGDGSLKSSIETVYQYILNGGTLVLSGDGAVACLGEPITGLSDAKVVGVTNTVGSVTTRTYKLAVKLNIASDLVGCTEMIVSNETLTAAYTAGALIPRGETIHLYGKRDSGYKHIAIMVNGVTNVVGETDVKYIEGSYTVKDTDEAVNITCEATTIIHPNFTATLGEGVDSVTYAYNGETYNIDKVAQWDIEDKRTITATITLKSGYTLGQVTGNTTKATSTANVYEIVMNTETVWFNVQTLTYTEKFQADLAAVEDKGTVTLTGDVTLADKLVIDNGKTFTIDLNGKTLTGRTNITHGNVTYKNGTIAGGSQQALNVYGSAAEATDYSVLTVNSDVTITADEYVICLFGPTYNAKTGYGAVVNFAGTIVVNSEKATTDAAIYVSGNLGNASGLATDMNNKINITGGSITSSDAAVGLSGLATVTISGGELTGNTGVAVKRGTLVVTGGTITANGPKNEPSAANGNGAEMTGAAISLSPTYAAYGTLGVSISGGTITSEKGSAVYIQTGTYANGKSMAIDGGTFKGAISLADLSSCITGGIFSAVPDDAYLCGVKMIANTDESTKAQYPFTTVKVAPKTTETSDVTIGAVSGEANTYAVAVVAGKTVTSVTITNMPVNATLVIPSAITTVTTEPVKKISYTTKPTSISISIPNKADTAKTFDVTSHYSATTNDTEITYSLKTEEVKPAGASMSMPASSSGVAITTTTKVVPGFYYGLCEVAGPEDNAAVVSEPDKYTQATSSTQALPLENNKTPEATKDSKVRYYRVYLSDTAK